MPWSCHPYFQNKVSLGSLLFFLYILLLSRLLCLQCVVLLSFIHFFANLIIIWAQLPLILFSLSLSANYDKCCIHFGALMSCSTTTSCYHVIQLRIMSSAAKRQSCVSCTPFLLYPYSSSRPPGTSRLLSAQLYLAEPVKHVRLIALSPKSSLVGLDAL